jgi:hypothetical protein
LIFCGTLSVFSTAILIFHPFKTTIMKRIFYALSFTFIIAILITACGSKTKAVNEKPAALTHADTVGLAEFQDWKAHNERVAAVEAYKKSVEKTEATPAVKRRATRQSGRMVTASENQAKLAKKKGWSKAAKGTAIGAGSGAAIGAVINKRNRALGAVIGGVLGGGVGYGIGRSMDKKEGRY